MVFLESLLVAVSTYSAIPVPQFEWNEKNMRYAICWFPAVGLFCSGGLLLWNWFCCRMQIDPILFAAVAVCLPLLITGGIHMDGYMDTVDALASHQSRERKLEIMKDSGCGAFAVLYCGIYLLLQFGFFSAVYQAGNIPVCTAIYVLSRPLSALTAVNMPNARKNSMLSSYTENAHKRPTTVIILMLAILSSGVLICLDLRCGGLAVLCSLLALLAYIRMAKKQFGGVTGDTSGFFLQIGELAALIGIWMGGLL